MSAPNTAPAALLQQLFGDNRAEWPSKNFGDLFVQPVYHSKLEAVRPCFLVGGRGTGKTTSLQSLHYEHRGRIKPADEDASYFGILVRMNKNRVRAFDGDTLPVIQWQKLFAHYFNLIVCAELCGLAKWLQERQHKRLPASSLDLLSRDLGLPPSETIDDLHRRVASAIADLQIYVNNTGGKSTIQLSMAESPIRTFATQLRDNDLLGDATVFCCVDEFENLLDYQQSVLNTYIKHAEPPLSYKIGVRKNGVRTRHTLDGNDLLKTPDDFAEIEIADEGFDYFAREVARLRLRHAQGLGMQVPEHLSEFLLELTQDDEAELLGAKRVAGEVLSEFSADSRLTAFFATKSSLEICFLRYWRDTDGRSIPQLAEDWIRDEATWTTRFGNYSYASLFSLSKGNKGARIRKYYCGERVLLALSAGNIRYFLELLEAAISNELTENKDIVTKPLRISPRSQTLAARDVGERRLGQLEGLAEHGVQLKRLVLAIGKVFFELARTSNGRTPEVTSFVLSGTDEDIRKVVALLSEGVGHLAFEVDTRTKATSASEMKDDEYRLHRIFCAFFEISHRKKRRTTFAAKDLLAVLDNRPARAISALLGNQAQTSDDYLPDQMALFSSFYEDKPGA